MKEKLYGVTLKEDDIFHSFNNLLQNHFFAFRRNIRVTLKNLEVELKYFCKIISRCFSAEFGSQKREESS